MCSETKVSLLLTAAERTKHHGEAWTVVRTGSQEGFIVGLRCVLNNLEKDSKKPTSLGSFKRQNS